MLYQVWSTLSTPKIFVSDVGLAALFDFSMTNVPDAHFSVDFAPTTESPTLNTFSDSRIAGTIGLVSEIDTPLVGSIPFQPPLPVAGLQKLQDWGLAGALTIGGTWPTNVPLFLHLDVSVFVGVQTTGNSMGSGAVNAQHTFGIPDGVPVFELPAGYTVNSASIGLVNGIIPAAATPEPGASALMLFALGAAAITRFGRLNSLSGSIQSRFHPSRRTRGPASR